jgi:replicative DNA helicase
MSGESDYPFTPRNAEELIRKQIHNMEVDDYINEETETTPKSDTNAVPSSAPSENTSSYSDNYHQRKRKMADPRRIIDFNSPTSVSTEGRVPPQAVDVEEAVIGAIILSRGKISSEVNNVLNNLPAFDLVAYMDKEKQKEDRDFSEDDEIKPNKGDTAFYKPAHQSIFRSMYSLNERKEPIDLITLTEELRKNGDLEKIGGEYYLTELTTKISSDASANYHSHIILERALLRLLIYTDSTAINLAYSETSDALRLIEGQMVATAKYMPSIKIVRDRMSDIAKIVDKEQEEHKARGGKPKVSTGYVEFDELTGGIRPKDLTVFGGRTKTGKTGVVLNIAKAVEAQGKSVLIFSEDPKTNVYYKLWANEAKVDSSKFIYGLFNEEDQKKVDAAQEVIRNKKLRIYDISFNLEDMISRAIDVKMHEPELSLVVLDGLQTFEKIEKYVKDENVLRRVLNRFKYGIGRDLEVAVAIIDQASIYAEVRKDNKLKIPEQNDLQGAASNIIEIADNVLILYRPELYWNSPDDEGVPNELKNMKIGDEKVSFEKKVGVIPAKQKMGGSESRLLGFDVVTTTLYSLRK